MEGVVDALRRLREALVPGGKLVDTQPLSPRPPVSSAGGVLGALDMREWVRTIRAVDREFARAIREGVLELAQERLFVVTDTFDSGAECAGEVAAWGGTRVPPRLESRLRETRAPVSVAQDVRLRLLVK